MVKSERSLRPVDLGRVVGLSAQSVRTYEAHGFLPPAERSVTGYRRYGPRHLHAIQAARVMVDGFGWEPARRIMAAFHGGDLVPALAGVDARHAELHRMRLDVERTLTALRAVPEMPGVLRSRGRPGRHAGGLHVGEAARRAGVRVSAVRFWEEQDLLHPRRDKSSRYRLYDAGELRKLHVVALLRRAGYNCEAIRTVLAELEAGQPYKALSAFETRLEELSAASRRASAATAAFWCYAQVDGPCPAMTF